MVAVAWVLNLDADEELAAPDAYAPRRSVVARSSELAARLRDLVGPDARLVPLDGGSVRVPGLPGRAFCPTPRALELLCRAGADAGAAPPIDLLRRVNDRAFAHSLGPSLPGARAVARWADLVAVVTTGRWLAKRAFTFAGRGHRRMSAAELAPGTALARWAEASFAAGLYVEPLVERRGDFGLHGHVGERIVFGEPTVQEVDERGQWIASRRADRTDLGAVERGALEDAGQRVARALAAAGYRGPFGVDAFRWVDDRRVERFHPLCEVNARYSMGWAVGMGDRRPDLPG